MDCTGSGSVVKIENSLRHISKIGVLECLLSGDAFGWINLKHFLYIKLRLLLRDQNLPLIVQPVQIVKISVNPGMSSYPTVAISSRQAKSPHLVYQNT